MAIDNDPAAAMAEELLERLGSLDEVKRYYEEPIIEITGISQEGLRKPKVGNRKQ